MYVRYGPETHAGASFAKGAQQEVLAIAAEDLQTESRAEHQEQMSMMEGSCHGIIVSTERESATDYAAFH